ncbi:MAG: hypothetical protein A2W86_02035 [Bacteroidetes bacterium GWD2_45_23]|nr:MAG: hypothetical protein A2W87_00945 [Bacteroidetes bacterium GWC2_46_850]OFX69105.1 MAG: hypothetical protein A2071_03000 [Bacteroidetes bacterium GWC1_47_7]OFX87206.1 MAG: hypothetical protein A2W86_02035 [Bacteroidetes bacterium GWD2_45_23]HAR38894.1 hypothetical protein [Porphyromonadaceae bacterium]HBB01780.1 hypothetical protein [Porphyromonadaceae bacterium]
MKRTADERIILNLSRHLYGNMISLALLFLLVLLRIIPISENFLSVGVTMERYAIMITIIAIPLSLKLFADRLKKIPRPLKAIEATTKYKKLFYLRLYTLSAVTLMNIALLGLSRNSNFMWFTIVLFIIFLFCRPSLVELTGLSELPDPGQPIMHEPQEPLEDE